MCAKREIEEQPLLPDNFSKDFIQPLTELCFRKDDPIYSTIDAIFIFGTFFSAHEIRMPLEHILKQSIPSIVIISGGMDNYDDSIPQHQPQSEIIYDLIKDSIPKSTSVYRETQSRNTLENVIFGLQSCSRKFLNLCFIAKSYHAGRCYLTLKTYLPKVPILQKTYDVSEPHLNMKMRADTWHQFPEYRSTVWGEYLRIKRYGEKGDLDPSEVMENLNKIEYLIKNS